MARYMCGTLDIGDTRFNDVPFVPSQDCLHWEFCQEDAYRQGREDQGELNTDTVREIHELVYQQGIEKGREETLKPIQKLLDDWFCDRVDDPNWVLSQISICIFNKTRREQ